MGRKAGDMLAAAMKATLLQWEKLFFPNAAPCVVPYSALAMGGMVRAALHPTGQPLCSHIQDRMWNVNGLSSAPALPWGSWCGEWQDCQLLAE